MSSFQFSSSFFGGSCLGVFSVLGGAFAGAGVEVVATFGSLTAGFGGSDSAASIFFRFSFHNYKVQSGRYLFLRRVNSNFFR